MTTIMCSLPFPYHNIPAAGEAVSALDLVDTLLPLLNGTRGLLSMLAVAWATGQAAVPEETLAQTLHLCSAQCAIAVDMLSRLNVQEVQP